MPPTHPGSSRKHLKNTGTHSAARSAIARSTGACATIGLIADTHIPDRVASLHPRLIPLLHQAGVSHILHAGDICARRVLDELQGVAPVLAVRGNRDFLVGSLPMSAALETCGARIKLVHGHFGWGPYLWDKVHFLRFGYELKRYLPRLLREVQDADAIVFGHTHYPEVINREGKLVVNPGSASFGPRRRRPPSFGLMRVSAEGKISVEIVRLTGWKIQNHEWVPV